MRKSLDEIPIQRICYYLGMRTENADDELRTLIAGELARFLEKSDCKACYMVLPVNIAGDTVDFSLFSVKSRHLSKNLHGCKSALVFAATIGIEAELQKKKASVSSPSKTVVLDAIGSAAIETFCDMLCSAVMESYPDCRARPRFSPGYGDFSLMEQDVLLRVLDANRKIGVTLTTGFLMIPQKSITAIMGIGEKGCEALRFDCDVCEKTNCEFRL